MKTLLLAGGILLLLLGVVLCVAALVVFLMARKKNVATGFSPSAPVPTSPPPVATAPPPVLHEVDADATIVAGGLGFGALHAVSGKLSGQTFPLKPDGFYIGRDRALAQVVLDDPSVSKRHVWVGVREGVPTAIDQSSTNGTYLNTLGTRIGQVRLSAGDTIIISDDVARFVYRA